MKTAREILIFLFASFVFIYVVSIFTFTPHYSSMIYTPSAEGDSLMGGFGAYIASFSFFMVGKGAYFFALPLFALVLALIFQKKAWFKPLAWSFPLIIIISGFYGLYSTETQILQGGLAGNLTGKILKNLFGYIGTTLILFACNLLVLSRMFPVWSEKISAQLLKKKSIVPRKALPSPSHFVSKPVEEKSFTDSASEKKVSSFQAAMEKEQNLFPIREIKKETILEQDFFENQKDPAVSPENLEDFNEPKLYDREDPDFMETVPVYEVQNSQETLSFREKLKNFQEPETEVEENSFSGYSETAQPVQLHTLIESSSSTPPMDLLAGFQEKSLESDEEETQEILMSSHHFQEENDEEEPETDFQEKASETNEVSPILSEKRTESSSRLHSYPNPPYHHFQFPPLDLLRKGDTQTNEDRERIEKTGGKLLSVLKEFHIEAKMENIITGPVVTRYELIPPRGLKVSKISNLSDNIALGIAAYDKIRIEAPIPGKSAVGIEVPNEQRQTVTLRDLVELPAFKPEKMAIPFALGTGISGKPFFTDISKIPHLLIAGSTGSGKSVCVNSLICSILYTKRPDEVKLILIDPKRVELKMYDDLPHLVAPVIKETSQAVLALNWAVNYMEERYKTLETYNVRNIAGYNLLREQEGKSPLPYLVIVIDEFADLMMIGKKEIEEPIIRLAAMARAVGIHLVLATQRPSVDVITGLIKANFPGRIAFKVTNKMESRIILDVNGADSLLGKGDMLYASPSMPAIKRIQSPFISDDEVYDITQFFKKRYQPSYWDEILEETETASEGEAMDPSEEPLFNDAVEIVVKERKASASYLQRRLKVGYNRAARMIEMMEDMGVVGPGYGSKPREVLIDSW